MFKQQNAVNAKFECQCNIKHIAKKCLLTLLQHQETETNTESIKKTQKSPADPVYLDIDQSLVNRKQSTQ